MPTCCVSGGCVSRCRWRLFQRLAVGPLRTGCRSMSLHTTSISRGKPSSQSERGVALVTSLLLIGLLTAIGVGLSLVSIVETWLGAGIRTSQSLSYAADAGVARVQADLASSTDWMAL